MKSLTDRTDLESFLSEVAGAPQALLLLDYDGTLAPFVTDRDRAYPYPGVVELIEKIIRAGKTKVIIVSGRPVEKVRKLLGLDEPVEIWGGHGAEWLTVDGRIERVQIYPEIEEFITGAIDWAKVEGLGERVEIKSPGIAFHWRGLDDATATALRVKVLAWWEAAETPHGLYLAEFDGGLELRVSGIDKGSVVEMILEELESGVPVAYLGDDETDEDAFEALGDSGLKVLVRNELRRTVADLWLMPPDDLKTFLKRWLAALGC